MKRHIPLFLITALFLCGAIIQASAQRMMISPEEQTKRLTDSLSLSKDQSAKVLTIYQDVDKKRQEIFNSNSEDRDAMRAAMRDLMEKTDVKIEALLTAKQKSKYEEMKATRMQRWQNRQQQPPPEKPKDESK
jgi:Spy/CpxP family protein refolding chaperone